jgi:hypothetical protein
MENQNTQKISPTLTHVIAALLGTFFGPKATEFVLAIAAALGS